MQILESIRAHLQSRKSLRKIVYAVAAAYVVLCAYFYIWQESHLVEPDVDPTGMTASDYEGNVERFTLPKVNGDDGEIHYRKYSTPIMPKKGTVFYLHGNRGDMDRCEWEIDLLLDRGYDVWTMDYRGFGDSIGTLSEAALKEDARKVFAQIVPDDPDKPIIVWGRSFGSGVAASVAASAAQKPEMLVLETPYWSLIDLGQQRCPIIPSVLFRYELPVHKFLKDAGCPIHLIHGTQDEKIDSSASDRLLEFCRANAIDAKGHSIMCGMHNLRDKKTITDFDEKVSSILK